MVLLLHEQRYSAYSLLSCQIFCLFDSTFLYLMLFFYLNSEQVDGNTVVCTLGRAARRSNVSDYVYRIHQRGLLKCSCLIDKHSCKHLENAHQDINFILNYRSEVLVVKATPLVYSSVRKNEFLV